jgi:hypothetical protein
MIDILDHIQSSYVPVQPNVDVDEDDDDPHNDPVTIQDRIFFGGDQLTEERSCNAKLARSDGDNGIERLEGIMPKVEDWHASRLIYQVCLLYQYICGHMHFTLLFCSV